MVVTSKLGAESKRERERERGRAGEEREKECNFIPSDIVELDYQRRDYSGWTRLTHLTTTE